MTAFPNLQLELSLVLGQAQEENNVTGQAIASSWDTTVFLSVEQRKAFAISVLAAGV